MSRELFLTIWMLALRCLSSCTAWLSHTYRIFRVCCGSHGFGDFPFNEIVVFFPRLSWRFNLFFFFSLPGNKRAVSCGFLREALCFLLGVHKHRTLLSYVTGFNLMNVCNGTCSTCCLAFQANSLTAAIIKVMRNFQTATRNHQRHTEKPPSAGRAHLQICWPW